MKAYDEMENAKPVSVNWRATNFRVGDTYRFSGLHGQVVESNVLTVEGIAPWGDVLFRSNQKDLSGYAVNTDYSKGVRIKLSDALAMVEQGILCEISEGPEIKPPWEEPK